jgi:AraC-like DNA-binding protein
VIIESENGMANQILPDTSIVMAFRFKGNISYSEENNYNDLPSTVITGLRKFSRTMSYEPGAATLLVIFNEGGAAAFFKEPLHELFGISLSLHNMCHSPILNAIQDQIVEAKDNRQRFLIVEQFLLSLLTERDRDLLVLKALEKIKLAKGNIRIKHLATDLHISQDPLEKRFRKLIGTSPKQFSNIIRMRNVINEYSSADSLNDASYLAGYFDQAHFIKEFKSFTGQTPHIFFKTSSYW